MRNAAKEQKKKKKKKKKKKLRDLQKLIISISIFCCTYIKTTDKYAYRN